MLKLMYITNNPRVAKIASDAGVDIIWIDMEVLGKAQRQGGMDTVQSHHRPEDIRRIRDVIGDRSQIMARVDPLHEHTQEQVEACVHYGADIMMLPMWKTALDLDQFVRFVSGGAKVMPLMETKEAMENVDTAVRVSGVDSIHIGLNDLHLSLGMQFMFQPLADGTVERLCRIIGKAGIPYGFGGIARPGSGMLPADYIIREHVHLGSSSVILSRSFCNTDQITDEKDLKKIFEEGVREIRKVEEECQNWTEDQFLDNQKKIRDSVDRIVAKKKESL